MKDLKTRKCREEEYDEVEVLIKIDLGAAKSTMPLEQWIWMARSLNATEWNQLSDKRTETKGTSNFGRGEKIGAKFIG